jgi:hypothetical protein
MSVATMGLSYLHGFFSSAFKRWTMLPVWNGKSFCKCFSGVATAIEPAWKDLQ